MFFHILPHTSPDSAEAVAGMFLTMAGITLCVISSMDDGRNGEVTQTGHWQKSEPKGKKEKTSLQAIPQQEQELTRAQLEREQKRPF